MRFAEERGGENGFGFAETLDKLSEEQKKKLLHFATGSDRAPIGGLKNLQVSFYYYYYYFYSVFFTNVLNTACDSKKRW